ncbi:alpha/beta hydrolase [Streptomyces sp. RKND-216]|uniref:alpha/beta fold hydrolase n=1 Tax=Streptomyces sp. RKND-216 TaxID=2562581 RepID=UPI001445CC71|nr:alpha/beta hydrolase [Streptomyces sp. RKND-216]
MAARLGRAYGVTVRPTQDEHGPTVVDRLLEHRASRGSSHRGVTHPAGPGAVPWSGTDALIEAARRRQNESDRLLDTQAAHVAQEPLRRVGVMGGVLTYHAAGEPDPSRAPVVVLNALGMGLGPWHRLIAVLAHDHRVLAWSPRGCAPGERPLRLNDHVADLVAVLHAEGVRDCHLLAWCTGPKVALEFHRRAPAAVRSMAFLHGSFRVLDRPDDPDTAYERNLESMCWSVARRPALAEAMRRMLAGDLEKPPDAAASDAAACARHVLSAPSRALAEEARRPFSSAPVLRAYARQLLDFWTCDPLPHAPRVTVPVLAVTGALDRTASPDRLVRDVRRFPGGRHVQLLAAGHHVVHDRPHELAELLGTFFARSSNAEPAAEPGLGS